MISQPIIAQKRRRTVFPKLCISIDWMGAICTPFSSKTTTDAVSNVTAINVDRTKLIVEIIFVSFIKTTKLISTNTIAINGWGIDWSSPNLFKYSAAVNITAVGPKVTADIINNEA